MTKVDDSTLDPEGLYHLATPSEWDSYRLAGTIKPASLEQEGFVHCSWGRQVMDTLARHFDGVSEVLALRLELGRVVGDLVVEDSYGSGEEFPHVYCPIQVVSVVDIVPVAGS